MNTTVTACDSCKKISRRTARADGWVIVRNDGIEKMAVGDIEKDHVKEFGTKGLDFCSWRCFRKYFRGKK